MLKSNPYEQRTNQITHCTVEMVSNSEYAGTSLQFFKDFLKIQSILDCQWIRLRCIMKQLQVPTSNVGNIRTTCKRRGIVRQENKYRFGLLAPQTYEQYVFVSRMLWNSQVNGQNLENTQCVFTKNGKID